MANIINPYKDWVVAWNATSAAMLEDCVSNLKASLLQQGHNQTTLQIAGDEPFKEHLATVCKDFYFHDTSLLRLNHRTIRAFKRYEAHLKQHGSDTSWMHLLDLYHVTKGHCWASTLGDGRHFLPLVPLEVHGVLTALMQRIRLL
jgi:hypothetical protein